MTSQAVGSGPPMALSLEPRSNLTAALQPPSKETLKMRQTYKAKQNRWEAHAAAIEPQRQRAEFLKTQARRARLLASHRPETPCASASHNAVATICRLEQTMPLHLTRNSPEARLLRNGTNVVVTLSRMQDSCGTVKDFLHKETVQNVMDGGEGPSTFARFGAYYERLKKERKERNERDMQRWMIERVVDRMLALGITIPKPMIVAED